MTEACLALGLPVIGGNVSLYNESGGTDIDPTPVIGALGLIDRLAARPPGVTLVEGAALVLLDASVGATAGRASPPSLGGSRWAVECRGHRNGTLPALDLAGHRRLVEFVAEVVAEATAGGPSWWPASTTCPGGGLGVALAELAVRSGDRDARWPGWPTTTSCSPRPRPGWWCAPRDRADADLAGGRGRGGLPGARRGRGRPPGGGGPGRRRRGRGHRGLAGPAAGPAGRTGPGHRTDTVRSGRGDQAARRAAVLQLGEDPVGHLEVAPPGAHRAGRA